MTAANSSGFPIESIRLDGGRPCLDFVNTVHDRLATVPLDYLATPGQYLEWCLRAHLLNGQEAERMAVTAAVMGEVQIFREHLHALLSARIDGTPVPAKALRECDRWLHQAWTNLSLDPGSSDSCGWLFYDDSKGGQRRWCSMEACGTIEKMRRYRRSGSEGVPRRRKALV